MVIIGYHSDKTGERRRHIAISAFATDIQMDAELVDVISFHDYLATRKNTVSSYTEAEKYAKQYNKPVINSELGCIGRTNSYDMALEICNNSKIGWYVFELMVQGYWRDIHGLVYPDRTIRDHVSVKYRLI